VGGAQGREGGEDAQREEGDDDEDDDTSSGGYVSPVDPFPLEPRRRPTEDELDKDFDPNDEVRIKPYKLVNLANAMAICYLC
jgi:hypothetical protein